MLESRSKDNRRTVEIKAFLKNTKKKVIRILLRYYWTFIYQFIARFQIINDKIIQNKKRWSYNLYINKIEGTPILKLAMVKR